MSRIDNLEILLVLHQTYSYTSLFSGQMLFGRWHRFYIVLLTTLLRCSETLWNSDTQRCVYYSVLSYLLLCIIISTTLYYHIYYSVLSYLLPCIIISTTLYYHIYYPVLSYLLLYIIISTTLYYHIYYSILLYLLLCIIVSTTLYLVIRK